MMSIEFLIDSLEGDADFSDIEHLDLNKDKDLTIDDCPFHLGSLKAKLWFKNVLEPYAKQVEIPEDIKTQYGDKVVGMYQGKPLVPGESGNNQADFQFLRDKIMITQGLSEWSATKIAGKVKAMKFGG